MKVSRLRMSAASEPATTLVIRARMPYGVSAMIMCTSCMTIS